MSSEGEGAEPPVTVIDLSEVKSGDVVKLPSGYVVVKGDLRGVSDVSFVGHPSGTTVIGRPNWRAPRMDPSPGG